MMYLFGFGLRVGDFGECFVGVLCVFARDIPDMIAIGVFQSRSIWHGKMFWYVCALPER